jgi:hypothetical protein
MEIQDIKQFSMDSLSGFFLRIPLFPILAQFFRRRKNFHHGKSVTFFGV